jgi:hypothetical protein
MPERFAGPMVRRVMRGALARSMRELAATLDTELAHVDQSGG